MAETFFDTYASTGMKEDVRDLITVVSPDAAPVYSMLRQGDCTRERHEWLSITLTTAADSKQIEGTAYGYASGVAETRLQNYTQIFRKTWKVSGTVDAVAKYGRGDEWNFRRALAMRAFKIDVEYELLDNTASAAGASTATSRELKGLPGAAMDGGVTATAHGTAALRSPIDEVLLNSLLHDMWLQGAKADHLICNGFVKRAIAGFLGAGVGRPVVSENGERTMVNVIDSYEGDFGRVNIVMTRTINPGSQVLACQNEFLSMCWLRAPFTETPPKDGDYFLGVLLGEGTLEYLNPNGVGRLTRVQSS